MGKTFEKDEENSSGTIRYTEALLAGDMKSKNNMDAKQPGITQISQEQVFQIVNQIPRGSVATYGQVAGLAGFPQNARLVGRILSKLPAGTKLPWHRVVNSAGKISNPNPQRQTERLQQEEVVLINGRINLKLYGWTPL